MAEPLRLGVDLQGRPWLVRPDGLLAFDRDLAAHPDRIEADDHRDSRAGALRSALRPIPVTDAYDYGYLS